MTALTGLALTMDILADTDVGGMRFEVARVSCSGEAITPFGISEDHELEDVLIPGAIPELENAPLDEGSTHLFADLFLTLDPGCYDVVTTPLTASGNVSADCAPASASAVVVDAGATTEILLINQCAGSGPGALDVISALNHSPILEEVTFEDSKFGETCVPRVVCATASDADGDPLEFVWQVGSGPGHSGPSVVSLTDNEDGSVTECVEVTAEEAGAFQLSVTVYDLLHDTSLVRIEDFLAGEGYPGDSHVSIDFPLYASGEACSVCGNGVVDQLEEFCDDGNAVDDDACSNACLNNIGCADGEREGFVSQAGFPDIAGCAGGFSEAGVFAVAAPACGRGAGDDSADPLGTGCNVEDFCAAGWHICDSSSDVAASSPSGCTGATQPGDPSLFFLTRQSGGGSASCTVGGEDDVFGCGNFGAGPDPISCNPLDRFSHDQCAALQPYWQCVGNEVHSVAKSAVDGGGILCCRD